MDPKFCYIAPTAYLEYTKVSNQHLVLAHLVDTDQVYADFYLARSQAGDTIMMDNSSYELHTPYSPGKLIGLGVKCGADAIVLPDYPFQPGAVTIKAAEKYIPLFKDAGFRTFFVPQSTAGDLGDWEKCYSWGANHPDVDIIGMSILGIPNALSHINPAFARVVMTHGLTQNNNFNHDKHHHYLGLNAGAALEVPSLLNMGVLDTIDSSGPIWSAILGHTYSTECDSYQMFKKNKLPVDFALQLTQDPETLDRIIHNIDLTESLFTSDSTNSIWYAK